MNIPGTGELVAFIGELRLLLLGVSFLEVVCRGGHAEGGQEGRREGTIDISLF